MGTFTDVPAFVSCCFLLDGKKLRQEPFDVRAGRQGQLQFYGILQVFAWDLEVRPLRFLHRLERPLRPDLP